MTANVEELRRLLEAATPEEWLLQDGFVRFGEMGYGARLSKNDAALIVAMRQALPGLLAEVERYRWLRNEAENFGWKDKNRDSVWPVIGTDHGNANPVSGNALDEGIDAALAIGRERGD